MKDVMSAMNPCRLTMREILIKILLLFSLLSVVQAQEVVTPSSGLSLVDEEKDDLNGVDGLAGANSIAVSQEGQYVYATGFSDDAVVVFSRDVNSGVLTFVQIVKNSDIENNGLNGANAVAVSPNDKHVYVASSLDNAVVVFTRDRNTGKLTLVEVQKDGINGGDGLGGASSIALSFDNKRVYVTGYQDNALTVFARDENTGALTFLQTQQDGVNGVDGLQNATAVAVSRDNASIYVTGSADNGIAVFNRNPAAGEIAFVAVYKNGIEGISGLGGAAGVSISSDKKQVYVTGKTDAALVAFNRDLTTGKLTYLQTYKKGENGIGGLGGASAIAISPDGSAIYVAGMNDNAIALFERQADGSLSFSQFVQNNTTLGGVTAITTDPEGNFVYTAAFSSNTVSAFSTALTELAVSMTAPESVLINSSLTYSITVTNQSAEPASGVVLTDTLPPTVAFAAVESSQGSCSHDASTQVVTCTLDSLAPAATATVTLTVTAPATVGSGTLNNSATVTAAQADKDSANNTAAKETQLLESLPTTDLKIVDITTTPSTTTVNSPLTYKVKVMNGGPDLATGVELINTLPSGVTFNPSQSDPRCSETTTGIVNCQLGNLIANSTLEVPVQITTSNTPGSISFAASIKGIESDPNLANNSLSKEVSIGALQADLALVDVVATPSTTVTVGTDVTYTITVTNNGPTNASEVVLTTILPPQVSYVTSTNSCLSVQSQVTCNLGTLTVASPQSVSITVTASQVGINVPTLFAVTSITDANSGNNSKSVNLTITEDTRVATDLGVKIAGGESAVLVGKTVNYTMTVTNNGPEATGAKLNIAITGNDVTLGTISGENCGTGDNFSCNLTPFTITQSKTVTLGATPNTVGQLTLTATVEVAGNVTDSVAANNTATQVTTVSGSDQIADLAVTLTANPNPATVEGNITYTTTVTNQGSSQASGVKVKQELPPDVILVSATDNQGNTCLLSIDNEITCSIGNLNVNGNVTITTVITPPAVGQLNSQVSVSSDTVDPDSSNNMASIETNVTETPIDESPSATLFFVEAQQNGLNGVQGLQGVMALALSPDGQHLYATGFNNNALVVFTRNVTHGQISFVQALTDDTGNIDGLAKASGVSISPDGAFVYVTSFSDNAVAVFRRDAISGTLTFVEVQKNGQNGVEGLGGAFAVTTTENQIYVAGSSDDAITIFNRDPQTGQLTFQQAIRFDDQAQSLDGVYDLTVTADGLHLLATSFNSNRLSVFGRNPTNGNLTLIQTLTDNFDNVSGLERASGVVVSPDGKQVYTVAGGSDNAISVFNRDLAANGTLTLVEVYRDGINGVEGLSGATALTMSADGNYIYVAGKNDNALALFKRHPETGQLSFVEAQTDGIEGINGLGGASAVVASPTGAHVYVAGLSDNAIAVFSIATADLSIVITESEDPVHVGNNLIYTLTVTNNGPQKATGIQLEDILPSNIKLISFSPSQGTCTSTPTNNQLNCALGTLNSGTKLTMSIVMSPFDTGELTHTVTVSADQFDPTSPSTVTETTQVVAEADLSLSMNAQPNPVQVQSELTYQMIVSNNGPDEAKNINLQNELPNGVQFVSAQVNTETTPCLFEEVSRTVNCTISSLAAGSESVMMTVVVPNSGGVTLTNTATVNATISDPHLDNNSQSQQVEVTFKIIEITYDNSGQNLHDYIISPTGAVIGGSVSGTIQNQGLISGVQILSNTLVSGGQLSKTILNEGIIENVQLLSGTVINGGTVRGNITGFPAAPATLNTHIAAGTQLSHVIIGVDSQVDPGVELGEGVSFMANRSIPEHIDLTPIFPFIIEPITESRAVNLSIDVLTEGGSLLEAINAIPELKNNDLIFSQASDTGNLSLLLGEEKMVVIPIQVQQASATDAANPRMDILADGQVIFITPTGRLVSAQPSTESPVDLQTVLNNLGLTQVKASSDGNLTVFAGEQLKIRPDLYTQPASLFDPLGLEGQPSPLIQGLSEFVLRFIDKEGKRRQQTFYPAPAHQEELGSILQGIPGANTVEFYNNGKISVKIGARTYSAISDYTIKTGTPNTVTQLLLLPDKNGDGSEDVRVIYANGDQQLLYLMPFPEVAAEIQNIPQMQETGYVVSQNISGYYVINKGDIRMFMKATGMNQLSENVQPHWVIYPDDSTEFITATGLQIFTQPLVQDIAALEAYLHSFGLSTVIVEENGNLTLPVNDTLSYTARPDLESSLSWLAMPLGLHPVPTSLPGVLMTMLVFRDEVGNKRQQIIYPTAKYPNKLYNFFTNMPTVESVKLENNGTISVKIRGLMVKGIFDYAVKVGGIPTGGIQFTTVPDINGDGIDDFKIVYGNGETQVIYQTP